MAITYIFIVGNPGAPIWIEEFADLQCPGCQAAHPIIKQVLAHYGPNTVYFTQHLYPLQLHRQAWDAHKVSFHLPPNLALIFSFCKAAAIVAKYSPKRTFTLILKENLVLMLVFRILGLHRLHVRQSKSVLQQRLLQQDRTRSLRSICRLCKGLWSAYRDFLDRNERKLRLLGCRQVHQLIFHAGKRSRY